MIILKRNNADNTIEIFQGNHNVNKNQILVTMHPHPFYNDRQNEIAQAVLKTITNLDLTKKF